MNALQRDWFLEEIKQSTGATTEISKEAISCFCETVGLTLKKSFGKAKMIEAIIEAGYTDRFYNAFSEKLYVPEWTVRKYLGLSKTQFSSLLALRIINAIPVIQEYTDEKGPYKALAYPLSVLKYDKKALQLACDTVHKQGIFRIRIETKTKEELNPILELMAQNFEILESPQAYEHSDGTGFYNYFKIRPIPHDKFGQKSIALKNLRLQEEVAQLLAAKERMANQISDMGNEIDNLFSQVHQLKGLQSNVRNAGRKPKFNDADIVTMQMMKNTGKSYNEIAKHFDTTKTTVIKYLK